jgi:probable DNA metabolism protein
MNRFDKPPADYSYDGTFEGLLSLVFVAWERRQLPRAVFPEASLPPMVFDDLVKITTCLHQSHRVWQALVEKTSQRNASMLHVAFLSQETGMEFLVWNYLKRVFSGKEPEFWKNLLDDDVFDLVQLSRKVKKEVHRFHGLVRFQKTADGMYFAPIDPDHDILKLLASHFKARFATQRWVIYDTRRNYGIYHDLQSVKEIVLENHRIDFYSGNVANEVRDIDDNFYRTLWQHYYDAINIIERKNTRQMNRAMPRRYWKYLPEKNKDSAKGNV